jgi:GTP-binding protein
LKINSAEYVKSAMLPEQFPRDRRPEIAFVGRSNVGKSSLMNRLLNRKNLAKTSGTPGKTRTVNFFDINGKFYFVDLPGYGFAKVAKQMKEQWNELMLDYLRGRDTLRLVVQLIDSRHAPSRRDVDMVGLLAEAALPTLLVATKIDKIGAAERARNIAEIRKTFELDAAGLVIPFSAVTGEGVGPVWDLIEQHLAGR